MTFSGGNSSRGRRRRLATEVAGHRSRSNGTPRRATARPRPPEPDQPPAIAYKKGNTSALALELEPLPEVEQANGSVSAHAPEPDPVVERVNGGAAEPVTPESVAEEASEPQPVRFKWDPETGQAVPIT